MILLEEKIGKIFSNIHCTNIFLGQSPKATEIKAKIKQRYLIKLISFCTTKETTKKKKKKERERKREQHTEWEKIVSNDPTNKSLISKIYKQLNNSTQQQHNSTKSPTTY